MIRYHLKGSWPQHYLRQKSSPLVLRVGFILLSGGNCFSLFLLFKKKLLKQKKALLKGEFVLVVLREMLSALVHLKMDILCQLFPFLLSFLYLFFFHFLSFPSLPCSYLLSTPFLSMFPWSLVLFSLSHSVELKVNHLVEHTWHSTQLVNQCRISCSTTGQEWPWSMNVHSPPCSSPNEDEASRLSPLFWGMVTWIPIP